MTCLFEGGHPGRIVSLPFRAMSSLVQPLVLGGIGKCEFDCFCALL